MKYDKVRLDEIEKEIRIKESKIDYIVRKEANIDDQRIKLLTVIKYLNEKLRNSKNYRTMIRAFIELEQKQLELDEYLRVNYNLDVVLHRCYPVRKDINIDYSGKMISYNDSKNISYDFYYCYSCNQEFLSSSELPMCPNCGSFDNYYET